MPPTEDIEETLKKAKMKRKNGKSTLKGHSTHRTSVAHKKALYEPTLE
jgi:hypothetical protein